MGHGAGGMVFDFKLKSNGLSPCSMHIVLYLIGNDSQPLQRQGGLDRFNRFGDIK